MSHACSRTGREGPEHVEGVGSQSPTHTEEDPASALGALEPVQEGRGEAELDIGEQGRRDVSPSIEPVLIDVGAEHCPEPECGAENPEGCPAHVRGRCAFLAQSARLR